MNPESHWVFMIEDRCVGLTDSRFASMKFVLLEPLRGLAAIWVLLFHFQFSDAFQQTFPQLHSVCKLGEMAVPMFFVISGYCIAASARSAIRKGESAGSFLRRRLRRIFPPYWASIAVVVALPFVIEGIAALKTGHFQAPSPRKLNYGFLKYDIAEWFEVVTLTRAFVTVPGADQLQLKFTTINAVYWSLAIEVQFYLIAAFAVRCGRRFYPLMAGITVVSVPFLLNPAAKFWGICLPYWPMFALGIGLYAAFERGWAPSKLWGETSRRVGWLALAGIVVATFVIAVAQVPIHRTTFAVVFAIALFGLEGLDAGFRRLLADGATPGRRLAELSVYLGTMSYSIYLVHGRVQFLAMQGVRQVFAEGTMAFDALSLMLTIALCYPFFRYCERPWISAPASTTPPVERSAPEQHAALSEAQVRS